MKINWREDFKRLFGVIAGGLLMALNLKTFVSAGGLLPGGANGLTVLTQRIALSYFNVSIPFSLLNITINLIPIYIGFRFVGKKFTFYSLIMLLVTGFFTDYLLCLWVDATSGGTDFIAIYLSEKKGVDTWNLIFYFNAVILLINGYLFGWDKALYSIIFQFVSTQTLSALYRNYQKLTFFIITDYPHEVAAGIHEVSHHGASIIKAEGAYAHQEKSMVYSVISSMDARKVKMKIKEIDPKAFINTVHSKDIMGRFYMKPKD